MSLINLPFTFTAGATIIAAQFNSNFQTIYNDYNGNVTSANLSAAATFPDSILQQIQTAGKVNASAITLLINLPTGAGFVPTANLGAGSASSSTFLRGDQTWDIPSQAFIKCSNTQNSGTSGGASVSGSWQTYPLNTKDTDTQSIASLATNQVTLPAGTYLVRGMATFLTTQSTNSLSQMRLFNNTGSSVLLNGTVTEQSVGAGAGTYSVTSHLMGLITLGVSTLTTLQYQVTTSYSNGLGLPGSFGPEVYGQIEFTKIG